MLSMTPQPQAQPQHEHRQTPHEMCAYRALYRSDNRDYAVLVRKDLLKDWILQLAWGGRMTNKNGGSTTPYPKLEQALEMTDVIAKIRKAHRYDLVYAETSASRETSGPALSSQLMNGLKKNNQASGSLQEFQALAPQMLVGESETEAPTSRITLQPR